MPATKEKPRLILPEITRNEDGTISISEVSPLMSMPQGKRMARVMDMLEAAAFVGGDMQALKACHDHYKWQQERKDRAKELREKKAERAEERRVRAIEAKAQIEAAKQGNQVQIGIQLIDDVTGDRGAVVVSHEAKRLPEQTEEDVP